MSSTDGQTPKLSGRPPRKEVDPNMVPSSENPTHKEIPLSPPGETDTTVGATPPIVVLSANTTLTFLTIIAHKAGPNSSSLSDIVTIQDDDSPDVLFLT